VEKPMPLAPVLRSLAGRLALCLTLLGGTSLPLSARAEDSPTGAAAKGAQVYCFMRSNGNSHEVSWLAAYALIKRQSASLFKTSPEHAAVMITEAVVQNPGNFSDCGKYLGDLYTSAAASQAQTGASKADPPSSGTTRSDRYAY